MEIEKLKALMIRSLDNDSDNEIVRSKIEEAGINYRFREGFSNRVVEKVFAGKEAVVREIEFVRNINKVFYRIALTGVAAIVLLLISIFMVQGSLSFDSVLGLGNAQDESIICLLTGN